MNAIATRKNNKNVMTAAEITRRYVRQALLAKVHMAIRDGKTYLETAWGRMKVNGYSDDTGWAHTGTGMNRRSFMVTLESIKIEA